jgi:hypothetical protein
MFEMFLFIVGIYTLVVGTINIVGSFRLSGWRARIASLFLIGPFPIIVSLRGIGNGLPHERAQAIFGLTELIVCAIGIIGAVLFSILTRPREKSQDHNEDSSLDI